MTRLYIIILACLCALIAGAQPGAYFPATVHDFGAIAEDDGLATCRFTLINVGTEPLAITGARATCGCTTPRYSRKSIAPGDSSIIEVSFDPQGRPGRFKKEVYVETNAKPSKVRLDIKGVVIGDDATIARRYPIDFGRLKMAKPAMMLGEVTKGKLKTAYFDGYNQSDTPMSITMTAAPKWLDVIVSPDTIGAGEQATFITYVTSTRCPLYGLVTDSVTFAIDDGTQFTLPVSLTLAEDFSNITPDKLEKSPIAAVPPRLDLGEIDRAAGPVSGVITISNAGKSPLEIRRVYSTDDAVDIAPLKAPAVKKGKSADIGVTVDPSRSPGALLNATVTVITNDPMQPVQTVRVVGLWK